MYSMKNYRDVSIVIDKFVKVDLVESVRSFLSVIGL